MKIVLLIIVLLITLCPKISFAQNYTEQELIETLIEVSTLSKDERSYLLKAINTCDDEDVNKGVIGCILLLTDFENQFHAGRKINKYINHFLQSKEKERDILQAKKVDEKKLNSQLITNLIFKEYLFQTLIYYNGKTKKEILELNNQKIVSEIVAKVTLALKKGGLIPE